MADMPLYAKNPRVANRYAKFPDDFYVVDHTVVDDNLINHPSVASRRWFRLSPQSVKTHYARATQVVDGKLIPIMLHRVIWEIANGPIPDGLQIDHINRNGLDNRLENLRPATRSQQVLNRAKLAIKKYPYKGVDPKQNRWRAYSCTLKSKKLHLGAFDTMEEAAVAYDVAMSYLFDDIMELNNIPDELVSPQKKQEIKRKVLEKLARHVHA